MGASPSSAEPRERKNSFLGRLRRGKEQPRLSECDLFPSYRPSEDSDSYFSPGEVGLLRSSLEEMTSADTQCLTSAICQRLAPFEGTIQIPGYKSNIPSNLGAERMAVLLLEAINRVLREIESPSGMQWQVSEMKTRHQQDHCLSGEVMALAITVVTPIFSQCFHLTDSDENEGIGDDSISRCWVKFLAYVSELFACSI